MKSPKRKRVSAAAATAVSPAAEATFVAEPAPPDAALCSADAAAETALIAGLATEECAALESTAVLQALADLPAEPPIALPSNSTVKDAAALKAQLLKAMESPVTVVLDVRSVERVDTATMQLLCAFVRDRAARNLGVQWLGCPPAIVESARVLGVQSLLALPAAGAA